MNIWIVNPFDPLPGESFRPGRYAFLADLLSDKGHKVTWWTSNFFHTTKSFRNPVKDKHNLEIIQLFTPAYKSNISMRRIWNHYVYAAKFARESMKRKNSLDIIIAGCPPLSSAMAAIKASKKLGAKCIIDIQDLWPETFETVLPRKVARAFFYPLRRYANSIYSSADALMAVSRDYARRALCICNNGQPCHVHVMYLGIDLKFFDKYIKDDSLIKKKNGEFWVTYIGTIGINYDIRTVLETAELLKSLYTDIKFIIAGDGSQLARIKNIARDKNLINCRFLGFLKFEKMVELLSFSDIGLNAVAQKSSIAFPNKVFDYMAGGLPIINSIQGELEELLKSENIGIQYEAGNAVSLRNAILELYDNPGRRKEMGKNARRMVEERFDKNKEYPKIEEFLRDVVKDA